MRDWWRELQEHVGRPSWPLVAVDGFHRGSGQHTPSALRSYVGQLCDIAVDAVSSGRTSAQWAGSAVSAAVFELSDGDKQLTRSSVDRVLGAVATSDHDRSMVRGRLAEYGIVTEGLGESGARARRDPAVQIGVKERSGERRGTRRKAEMVGGSGAVDVAFLTVLPEEYEAVLSKLDRRRTAPPTEEAPNRHSWELAEVNSVGHTRPYRVVLGIASGKGSSKGLVVVRNTLDAFRPRYVVLVGIAGGLSSDLGDVVVSSRIFGYEYGKVERGFVPRPDWNFQSDSGIMTAASTMESRHPDWVQAVSEVRPKGKGSPQVIVGPVASGNKVVDDISDPSFAPVIRMWPELAAVEMEGIGAAEAIEEARERGISVNFSMVRGISDRPAPTRTVGGQVPRKQSTERDAWKRYAADTAAALAIEMLRRAWSLPPRTDS